MAISNAIYLLLNAFTYLKELFRANAQVISTSCHALPCFLYMYMYISALSMVLFRALVQIKVLLLLSSCLIVFAGPRVSPDVILISDTTVAPTTPKMTMVNVPVAHISGNQLQMQPMTSVIASPSSGAVSQQVYKFVTLPSSVPVNNQYTLRPMLTLPVCIKF